MVGVSLCENGNARVRLGSSRDVVAKTNGSSRGRCQSGGHREIRARPYETHGRACTVPSRRDS